MPLIRIKNCISEGPCKGQSHEWEFDVPRLKEARHIQSRTGLTKPQWGEAMTKGDADAVTALIDILHRRIGIALRWEDIDLDDRDIEWVPTAEEEAQIAAVKAEGKGESPAPSSTSGPSSEAASMPRWPTTPPSSGNTSG